MALRHVKTATGNFTLNHVSSPPPAGNNLATAAAALEAGSGAPSYAAFSPSTLGVLVANDIMDWCVRWHWDPTNLRAWLMCKRAGSTGTPHKLFRYDAAGDTLAKLYDDILTIGGGSGSGHGYDCGAINQATGDFYFVGLYAENVIRWNGSAWVVATGNISGGTSSSITTGPPGLVAHPHLFGTGLPGLVNIWSNRMRVYNRASGDSGAWAPVLNLPYSNVRYSSGVYCEALNAVIMSGGDAGLGAFICYGGSTPAASRMPFDLPIPCTSTATNGDTDMARMMPTPSGSVAIFESASPGRVWRLDKEGDLSWDIQPFTHNLRLNNSSWPTMYASTYGLYWALREVNAGNSIPNSILWRPPATL